MRIATRMLRVAQLQEHLDSLKAWKMQNLEIMIRASFERQYAFEMHDKLNTAIKTVEMEIEILSGGRQ